MKFNKEKEFEEVDNWENVILEMHANAPVSWRSNLHEQIETIRLSSGI